jgi:putative membrane protein
MYQSHKSLGAALLIALTSLGVASVGAQTTAPSSASSTTTTNSASDSVTRADDASRNTTRSSTVGRDVDDSKLSRGDRRFVEKAGKNGLAEVQLARLAVERSSDPRVRSFAQQLVTDHEKANSELSALAARKGITIDQDTSTHQFRALSDKTGPDFDKRFISHMSDEHEDDIEMFEKAARKSDDPEIAAFASKQLPVLQQHRQMSMDIEKSIKR